jgi:alkanesulfonate monooxygenase SsuD/methylene tetrahydromethanopterin reductase-like flavin-dependent oxidoreductase (luciferase family)
MIDLQEVSMAVTFGWRIPDFPLDGSHQVEFRTQIFDYLDMLEGQFETAWAGDHFFPWLDTLDQRVDTIESMTTLSYVLAKYPRLKAGTIVLSQGYRSPALLKKMAANLQWLSGGRFILGIGAGWKENEYRAYGYDYPSTGQRLDQLDEALQVIRAMWTQPAPAFQGQYYTIQDAYCNPLPDPPPPLLIGGHGRKKTLRMMAKYADWLNFNNCTLEEYAELLGVLDEHCQAVGRDPAEIVRTYSSEGLAVAPTRTAVDRMLADSPFGELDKLAGTPDESYAKIRAFADLGVQHFIVRFPDFPHTASAKLFIKEVLPGFA